MAMKTSSVSAAAIDRFVNGETEVNDLAIDLNSDLNELRYKLSANLISSGQIELNNFLLEGTIDSSVIIGISSTDIDKNTRLKINSIL